MEITEDESRRLEKLIHWSESKSWNIFILVPLLIMVLVIIMLGISAVLGGILWYEVAWIMLLFMVLIVWVKGVHDIELNLKFTLDIIKRQREVMQELRAFIKSKEYE
jgi:hypothetical protein